MKTSNKILSTAFAAYLLFTAGNSAAILKEYKRAEASGKALITHRKIILKMYLIEKEEVTL